MKTISTPFPDLGNSMALMYISTELEAVALNENLGIIAQSIGLSLRKGNVKGIVKMLRDMYQDNKGMLEENIKPELLNKILTVKI